MTKLWFSVTQAEQRTRFIIRQVDPVRQWKLTPIDLQSLDEWDDYAGAKEAMIRRTDTEWTPWTMVKSNDRKRARINAMRAFLFRLDYDGKDPEHSGEPDPKIVHRASTSATEPGHASRLRAGLPTVQSYDWPHAVIRPPTGRSAWFHGRCRRERDPAEPWPTKKVSCRGGC